MKAAGVQDLRISFRTSNGKVQAVRGINFDLAKGETLAIVGESGSGKSVTSKAILGIQAGNAITESGEIIYDGQDLLKINEEAFHKIRGDKIAMIFQDPMSSLNPIVKIGKQLTEAMLLKGKARQRESRTNFNTYLKHLNTAMIQAVAAGDKAKAAELTAKCKSFDKFEFKHTELEAAYNAAAAAANQALLDIETVSFELEKKSTKDLSDFIGDIAKEAAESVNAYVVSDKADRIKALVKALPKQYKIGRKTTNQEKTLESLYEIRDILTEAVAKKAPNFFRMGYYLTFCDKNLPEMDVEALDAHMLERLDKEFMLDFIDDAKKAIIYTAGVSYDKLEEAVKALRDSVAVYSQEKLDKKTSYATFEQLCKTVMATIDPLARSRDSLTYTFHNSVKSELDTHKNGNFFS